MMMTEPLFIPAGDGRVLLGNPPTPPKVDCRVVSEETYQALIAAIPDATSKQLTPPPPRRPLSSLTEQECKEVYRIAARTTTTPPLVNINKDFVFIGWSHGSGLDIYTNGNMSLYSTSDMGECDVDIAEPLNAVAVVRFLDKLGIIFDP